jgi:hypothetical protein
MGRRGALDQSSGYAVGAAIAARAGAGKAAAGAAKRATKGTEA